MTGWPEHAPGGTSRRHALISWCCAASSARPGCGLDPADLRQAALFNHELYGFYGVSVWVTSTQHPRNLLETSKLRKFERYAEFTVADLTGRAPIVALPLAILALTAATQASSAQARNDGALNGTPNLLARQNIPSDYLRWYQGASRACPGLPWSVLAGIGKVESDHGRSDLPGVQSGADMPGAEGPMQILPSTFARYAVNADPSMPLSPYDPVDAIYSAASVLCAAGARSGNAAGIDRAIFAYNHAARYVSHVLMWAVRVRYTLPSTTGAVATAIAYAEAQLGKPYCWGGIGPGCFDCSGLVSAAYAAAGIHIARTTFQWQEDGPEVRPSQIQPR